MTESTIPAQRAVENLAWKLRRRQVVGARQSALETLLVLRQVVSKARFSNIDQIISTIKAVGRRLVDAQPKEHTIGSTVRKILHYVREEYQSSAPPEEEFTIARFIAQGQPRHNRTRQLPGVNKRLVHDHQETESSTAAESDSDSDQEDPDVFAKRMKPVIVEAIQDALYDLETVYDNISKNAKDHIHSDEIILTLSPSKTLVSFLKSASSSRNYTLLIAAPDPASGTQFAQSLSASSSNTQIYLVPFSSIHTLISRVNKLLLSAHSILPNGGIFTQSGGKLAAESARMFSVNVVVVAGQFKITPVLHHRDEYGSLDFGNPDSLGDGVFGMKDGALVDKVDKVVNPYFDYVGPECIDVFITNDGDHPPASIFRLLKETYDDEDNVL